jgi:hypothetical protein
MRLGDNGAGSEKAGMTAEDTNKTGTKSFVNMTIKQTC